MNKSWASRQAGFTIVELLIVIVVIAILAAVTIVAFNGIQNRANDSAVQSDLNALAKKLELAAVDNSSTYPVGGATRNPNAGDSTNFPGFTFGPTKSAYATNTSNLYYCTGTETSSGNNKFLIFAKSKSGNTFRYSSTAGLTNLGNVAISVNGSCTGFNDPFTWSYGYYNTNNVWWGWTNG